MDHQRILWLYMALVLLATYGANSALNHDYVYLLPLHMVPSHPGAQLQVN